MKIIPYFLIAMIAFQASARAADLTIEYVPQANERLTVEVANEKQDPPVKLTKNDYGRFSAGLGYRSRTGTTPASGGFATLRWRAYSPQSEDEPLAFSDGGANFNVFNWEPRVSGKTTEFAGVANVFVGHTFITDNDKVGFYLGGMTHLSGDVGVRSLHRGEYNALIGAETGFHVSTDKVVATLAGSVTLGGDGCSVELENGQKFDFRTNALGFAGIARLLVSDKFYMNVLYVEHPSDPSGSSANRVQGGKTLDTTLFYDIGSKLTLTGNCSMRNNDATIKTNGQNGAPDRYTDYHLNSNQFQIGIIQRF